MGANAQTSVWSFTAGNVLTAAQLNDTARTGVPVFATTVTRDAAFGGTGEKTLAEGQTCYIEAAPKRLQVYDGTNWLDFDTAYTAYTATFTNVTIGNGTQEFEYARLGKFVHFVGYFTLGSTSSISGNITINLPLNADTTMNLQLIGNGAFTDAGTAAYPAFVFQNATGSVQLFTANVAGTYIGGTVASSATIPFTFGTNDVFALNIVYKAA